MIWSSQVSAWSRRYPPRPLPADGHNNMSRIGLSCSPRARHSEISAAPQRLAWQSALVSSHRTETKSASNTFLSP